MGVDELARRVGLTAPELAQLEPSYHEFHIRKRSGGTRRILAPSPELKQVQRRIHRRLLAKLRVHPAVKGFQRGESIVSNARPHQRQAVVVRLDVRDFFDSTAAPRIAKYLRTIGWNRPATRLLVRLCTHDGGLPQGAPTSPRLSNLVNYPLDARLAAAARSCQAAYTRYADDLTFSFAEADSARVNCLKHVVRLILLDYGYRVHRRRKVHVRHRHRRQIVTGLVVNHRAALPRETRRWLRAVRYRASYDWRTAPSEAQGPWRPRKDPTLSPEQLAGWNALEKMISEK